MFVDKATITVKAGKGGNGCVSFHREKYVSAGGPDGGDGGRGGDIVFVGTTRADNLVEFRFTKKFFAGDGANGGTRNKAGAGAVDLKIPVPLGTKIYRCGPGVGLDCFVADAPRNDLLADITSDGEQFRALKGGAGGKGNAFFATSRKQTPNFAQTGIKTKEYKVTLELSCIADVGLVGFPNVGKSTLLSVISRANPKIANYHFTTLHPNLGVVVPVDRSMKPFIVADIPGLIEGASDGAGLGHEFLRHIDRTRLLVHVIDISGVEGRDPVEDYKLINKELVKYSPKLADKVQIIALNKSDIDGSKVADFKKAVKGHKIFVISSATRQGIDELLRAIAVELENLPRVEAQKFFAELEEKVDKNKFEIEVEPDDDGVCFIVTGPLIDNLIRGVVLTDTESNAYFHRRLKDSGVIAAMREKGLQDGDTVRIADVEFEWVD
jgi:GTP-binding protein